MKTTIDLPDELMRAVKIRAVNEGRRLKDLVPELIKIGLAETQEPSSSVGQRVRVPLVQCAHPSRPGQEMTPERVAEILLSEEAVAVQTVAEKAVAAQQSS